MPKAREVMSPHVVSVDETTLVSEVVATMKRAKIGAVVVNQGASPAGIFTERDVVMRVLGENKNPAATAVSTVMTKDIYVANADHDIESVFDKMKFLNIRHVPIVENGAVVGLISIRDLVRASHNKHDAAAKLGTWMSENPVAVAPTATVAQAIVAMVEKHVGAILVQEGDKLVGIFTERDLLNRVAAKGLAYEQTIVKDVMTPNPRTATPNDSLESVYDTFQSVGARHLPVVTNEGRIVGIVSIRDMFNIKERLLTRAKQDREELLGLYQDLLAQADDSRLPALVAENERLKSDALTDGLTGLYNYRYFEGRFEEEFDRAKRYNRPLSLIFCDIDNFKHLNDTYGHPAGDEILRDLASLLTNSLDVFHIAASFRKSDLVVRYGGEEFVFLLPETDAPGGFLASERVRNSVKNFQFLASSGNPIRVTMSFGIASFPSHATSADDLLRRADQALYAAKSAGKDQCVIYWQQ